MKLQYGVWENIEIKAAEPAERAAQFSSSTMEEEK